MRDGSYPVVIVGWSRTLTAQARVPKFGSRPLAAFYLPPVHLKI